MLLIITITITELTTGVQASASDLRKSTLTQERARAVLSQRAAEMAIDTLNELMRRFCCLTLVTVRHSSVCACSALAFIVQ